MQIHAVAEHHVGQRGNIRFNSYLNKVLTVLKSPGLEVGNVGRNGNRRNCCSRKCLRAYGREGSGESNTGNAPAAAESIIADCLNRL